MAILAFLGAFALSAVLGGRGADRALLDGLMRSGFDRGAVLAVAVLTGGLATGVAAWLGKIAVEAVGPDRGAWIGIAAACAAIARMLVTPPRWELREPTRSLFAIALVLSMIQAIDAVRLAVLALAAWSGEPLMVACGALLGAPFGLASPQGQDVR